MGKGLVTGICFRELDYTVILVPNTDPVKPKGFHGFPGGIIEDNETPREAMKRELGEEVGGDFDCENMSLLAEVPRRGRESSYIQYIFLIKDTGKKLRRTGVDNEVDAPIRATLKDAVSGNIPVFRSHLAALLIFLKIDANDPILVQLRKVLLMRLELESW